MDGAVESGTRMLKERLSREIDLVVSMLRGKKVEVGEVRVDFVDREGEARAILEGVARIKPLDSTVVLYGPKGCGKTTLFEALVESIHSANERVRGETLFDILMVSYRRDEKVGGDAADKPNIMGSGRLIKNLGKPLKKLGLTSISINVSPIPSISIGIAMGPLSTANTLIDVLHKMIEEKKLKKNGRLLVVIDEARATGEQALGIFRDWLEVFANDARRVNSHYMDTLDGRISFIVLTSDASVTNIRSAVGIKVDWLFMWNLPRDAFERLADQLGVGENRDLLWNLTGGNPRALGYIAEKGLHAWLEKEIVGGVRSAIVSYLDSHPDQRSKIWDYIAEAAREPLGFLGTPLKKQFLYSNIIITEYDRADIISEMPGIPTIGRANAYQIPAYYYVLRAIAKKGQSITQKIEEAKIEPEEVIEEAKKINT